MAGLETQKEEGSINESLGISQGNLLASVGGGWNCHVESFQMYMRR